MALSGSMGNFLVEPMANQAGSSKSCGNLRRSGHQEPRAARMSQTTFAPPSVPKALLAGSQLGCWEDAQGERKHALGSIQYH